MKKKKYEIERDLRYLTLLAQSFPTVAEASTEIINLQACPRAQNTSWPTCMASTRLFNMC